MTTDDEHTIGRREYLKAAGATGAATGLAGCADYEVDLGVFSVEQGEDEEYNALEEIQQTPEPPEDTDITDLRDSPAAYDGETVFLSDVYVDVTGHTPNKEAPDWYKDEQNSWLDDLLGTGVDTVSAWEYDLVPMHDEDGERLPAIEYGGDHPIKDVLWNRKDIETFRDVVGPDKPAHPNKLSETGFITHGRWMPVGPERSGIMAENGNEYRYVVDEAKPVN